LAIGSQKLGSSSSLISTIGEPTIGIIVIGTGESIMGSTTTLPCTMGVTVACIEKNGYATIRVGTYTRFSSSYIS
jgi:hypothetical protein